MPDSSLLDTEPTVSGAESAPSLDQWRALYKAAQAFRNIVPWTFVSDAEYFGVVMTDTGKTWYLSVRGAEQQPFGLIVFNGPSALAVVEKLRTGLVDTNAETLLEYADTIPEHDYLIAAFGDRTEVLTQDNDIIRALKLKFHGARDWPLFRSVRKNSVDWFITAGEASVLTTALQQAFDIIRRRRVQLDLLAVGSGGEVLIRVNTDDGWVDERREREPIPVIAYEPQPAPDADTLAKLNAYPLSDETIEIDYFWSAEFEGDGNTARQYFQREGVVVDSTAKEIITATFLGRDDFAADLPGLLAVSAALSEKRYAKALVAKPELITILQPIADALGTSLELVNNLETLNELRKAQGLHAIQALQNG